MNGDGAIFSQRNGRGRGRRRSRTEVSDERRQAHRAVAGQGYRRIEAVARCPAAGRLAGRGGVSALLTARRDADDPEVPAALVQMRATGRGRERCRPRLRQQFAEAVRGSQTILIAGGTDTGKTTFAKALIDFIPQDERLGVIEDTVELKIDHPNVFRFEARKEQIDRSGTKTIPAVTIRDLVKATLRHRPDRLIIGEVRGGEAFDLLDALNTGHAGSISTVHANSALQALSRLATLTLRADVDLPYRAIQGEIGDLIDLVIHIERRDGRRASFTSASTSRIRCGNEDDMQQHRFTH